MRIAAGKLWRQASGARRRASTRWGRLPALLRLGLAIFGLGGLGDLAYHVLPAPMAAALVPVLGAGAGRAHLITLLGMLAIFAGVVRRGADHAR